MEKEYFISKEEFLAVKETWAKRPNNIAFADEHIIYNALRSLPLDRGFTEKKKNIQGNTPWYAFIKAKMVAYWRTKRALPGEFKKQYGIDIPDGLLDKLK